MKYSDIDEKYCKQVECILKKFAFEPNNEKIRLKIVDGIYEHFIDFMRHHECDVSDPKILCNEVNNTQETIGRDELHVTVSFYDVQDKCMHNINFNVYPKCSVFEEIEFPNQEK